MSYLKCSQGTNPRAAVVYVDRDRLLISLIGTLAQTTQGRHFHAQGHQHPVLSLNTVTAHCHGLEADLLGHRSVGLPPGLLVPGDAPAAPGASGETGLREMNGSQLLSYQAVSIKKSLGFEFLCRSGLWKSS